MFYISKSLMDILKQEGEHMIILSGSFSGCFSSENFCDTTLESLLIKLPCVYVHGGMFCLVCCFSCTAPCICIRSSDILFLCYLSPAKSLRWKISYIVFSDKEPEISIHCSQPPWTLRRAFRRYLAESLRNAFCKRWPLRLSLIHNTPTASILPVLLGKNTYNALYWHLIIEFPVHSLLQKFYKSIFKLDVTCFSGIVSGLSALIYSTNILGPGLERKAETKRKYPQFNFVELESALSDRNVENRLFMSMLSRIPTGKTKKNSSVRFVSE